MSVSVRLNGKKSGGVKVALTTVENFASFKQKAKERLELPPDTDVIIYDRAGDKIVDWESIERDKIYFILTKEEEFQSPEGIHHIP